MIEPTDEMLIAWRDAMKAAAADAVKAGEPLGRSQEVARAGLAAVLAIERAQSAEGLDLIDVVPSPTEGCLSLQCTGCGWTRHIAPGYVGGRALAHIVDLAQAHAREVDHGESEAP